MNQTRSFHCPPSVTPTLVDSLQTWLLTENFNCQKLKTEEGGTLLQVEKKGGWRKFTGMSTALNILFRQVDNTINVEIGAGRWMDKAAAGAVSLFVLWPLAVTAGIGAWQQSKMPERIYEHIDMFIKQTNA